MTPEEIAAASPPLTDSQRARLRLLLTTALKTKKRAASPLVGARAMRPETTTHEGVSRDDSAA